MHRLAGGGGERFGVQMGDGGQSAQRRGAAVVQPVAGIQRLGGLGVGGQRHLTRVDQRRGLESGAECGDLVAVQSQRWASGQPRRLKKVSGH